MSGKGRHRCQGNKPLVAGACYARMVAGQPNRHRPLGHIADECQDAQARARQAAYIGGPDIAAACPAYVDGRK